MDEGMSLTMEQELIADLTAELQIADPKFDSVLLASKVKNVLREVKRARKYPSYYPDEQIKRDMYQYYSNCRALSLYDYNKIGIEFEKSHGENSVSQGFEDRDKLFAGIIPLAK